MILIANDDKDGWKYRIVGEILWVYVGIKIGMSSIWFWGLIFITADLYGLYKWRNKIN
jgi:hypothetical protein